MRATDVTAKLGRILEASGCDRPTVLHRPRLPDRLVRHRPDLERFSIRWDHLIGKKRLQIR